MQATSAKQLAPAVPAGVGWREAASAAAPPRLGAPPGDLPKANDADWTSHKPLIETLTHSKIYQEYARAFTEATGLPLCLRPVE